MQVNTVITKREAGISSNAIATTREDEPNVKIITMPWWQMIGIRAARVYLQSLTGFMMASFAGVDAVTAHDFSSTLWLNMGIAIAPTVMSILTNSTEILTKLDISNPQLRA